MNMGEHLVWDSQDRVIPICRLVEFVNPDQKFFSIALIDKIPSPGFHPENVTHIIEIRRFPDRHRGWFLSSGTLEQLRDACRNPIGSVVGLHK